MVRLHTEPAAGRKPPGELVINGQLVAAPGIRQRWAAACAGLACIEVAAVRLSKELGNSKCSALLKSMGANSDHSNKKIAPELNQHLVRKKTDERIEYINEGLDLGNQNLSTDMLASSPRSIIGCLIEQGDTNRECRHRRK
eukprot:2489631-Heterocapsa_arctica.AAC.1